MCRDERWLPAYDSPEETDLSPETFLDVDTTIDVESQAEIYTESMLDEIIDCVKFLQQQVKVLSMSRVHTAGTILPLITHVQAEDAGSMHLSSVSQVADQETNENVTFQRDVVKLFESGDTAAAHQCLQSKGFCLMPITLATAISNHKGSSAAMPPPLSMSERNDQNEELNS